MSGAVYYRVRELAERWRISQGKVRLLIRKGELPEVRMGKVVLVPAAAALRYEDECRRKAVAVNE